MSYNLLSGTVNFEGSTQGTIEDMVDTHSTQTINGQKTFSNLSSSSDVKVTGDINVVGNVSASINISASAFYSNGVLLDPSAVTFDGSTANGVLTFKDSDEATVESNLTFDGSVLDFKNSSISGSGNISGSQFYGTWAGSNILGSQVQLVSAGGIANSSGLTLSIAGVAAQSTPNGNVTLFVDDSGTIKKSTITQLLTNQSITDATALGNANRILLDGGVGTISTNAGLTFNGTVVSVTGKVSASSDISVGGILRADNHFSASNMTLAGAIKHQGDEDTQIRFSTDSVSIAAGGAELLNILGNTTPKETQVRNGDFKVVTAGAALDFMVSSSSGFVGIGTTTPAAPLEISSSNDPQLKLTYNGSNATQFTVASNGDLTINPNGSATFDSSLIINDNTTLGNGSGDVLTINGTNVTIPNGLNFDSNTLVIDHSNDRVGIGVSHPTKALEVNGDVQISGVTPFITIGDGGAEDCGILLNSTGSGVSGIDYYVAIDYSYNSNRGALMLGAGPTVGTNSAIQISDGRIGVSHNGATPSAFSVDKGHHMAIGTLSQLPAHNVNESVIGQVVDAAGEAYKIPAGARISKVILVVLEASTRSTHNAAVFMAADASASVDSTLSSTTELIGAGASGTRSTLNTASATDIDLKQGKKVWVNEDGFWLGGEDRYIYLVNAGTANGTSGDDVASVIIYVEYYGID